MTCPICGEPLEGNGYSVVLHCPDADLSLGYEPDANPVYCDREAQIEHLSLELDELESQLGGANDEGY